MQTWLRDLRRIKYLNHRKTGRTPERGGTDPQTSPWFHVTKGAPASEADRPRGRDSRPSRLLGRSCGTVHAASKSCCWGSCHRSRVLGNGGSSLAFLRQFPFGLLLSGACGVEGLGLLSGDRNNIAAGHRIAISFQFPLPVLRSRLGWRVLVVLVLKILWRPGLGPVLGTSLGFNDFFFFFPYQLCHSRMRLHSIRSFQQDFGSHLLTRSAPPPPLVGSTIRTRFGEGV